MKRRLNSILLRLYSVFGSQYWWPAESVFEVIVGAIFTQNTSWLNVQKAIAVLKGKKLLNARKLYKLSLKELANLIKSSGFYNIKADADYSSVQNIFMRNLKTDVKLFNEYYALLVKLGKDYCRKQNPKCRICPLNGQ
ncbi:MAG: hypothetical protein WCY09_02320 [Candidatus Omnitrophota bacterium]